MTVKLSGDRPGGGASKRVTQTGVESGSLSPRRRCRQSLEPFAGPAEQAEALLERANRIDVSQEIFERFVKALDGPSAEMPVLRRYARKRSPIPQN